MPQTVLLDELDQDNILLEHIKIKEDTDEELKNQQELCILDQVWNTIPHRQFLDSVDQ